MLGAISEELGMSYARIDGMRRAGLGAARVDSAVHGFCEHWTYGWGLMGEKLRGTGLALSAAAGRYEKVETTLAGAFMKLDGTVA